MKAQLSFEYMLAFGIFIGIVVYIYLSYIRNIPPFIDEITKEAIRSDVYQISELLVNNPGEPAGWSNAATSRRIGFLNETANRENFLSETKITNGISFCGSNYNSFKGKIGTNKNFTLVILDVDTRTGTRTLIGSCNANIAKTSVNTTIKRIVTYTRQATGQIRVAELMVQV